MSSRDELAANRAAHQRYAEDSLAADHAAHVDQHGTPADLPAPESTSTAFGATQPAWANTRGSGG